MPTGQQASEKPLEGCWAGLWFDCVSRDTSAVGHLFRCLLAVCLLWRNVYSNLYPIFKLGCFSFYLAVGGLCILILNSDQVYDLQIFLPVLWIVFSIC